MISEKELLKYLAGIVIGIRFRPNFSIEDRLGEMVDEILYSKGSYFNSTFFPTVNHGPTDKTLSNDKTGDKLTISNSEVVLDVALDSNPEKAEIQYGELINSFQKQILDGVLSKVRVKEIVRVGFIHRFITTNEKTTENFIQGLLGDAGIGINEINLKFSRREEPNSKDKKNKILDYQNFIYQIIKNKNGSDLLFSLDYQEYFLPALPEIGDLNFKGFIKSLDDVGSKELMNWVNKTSGLNE